MESYQAIWEYDRAYFIALMFHTRQIDYRNINLKGKGERLNSYDMALWLLRHHEDCFILNHNMFISFGCFKDCLLMAKIAINENLSTKKIMMILTPMAIALINDTYSINRAHIFNIINPPNKNINLSLASKWAPREGKAFSETIPFLKKLCNIKGPNSDEAWRKYIRNISKAYGATIEEILSKKKPVMNLNSIPSKALLLYQNKLPAITNDILLSRQQNPFKILTGYFNSTDRIEPNFSVEHNWRQFMNTVYNKSLINKRDKIFIPVFDMTNTMYENNAEAIVNAVTFGLVMSNLNVGMFNRKSITFSTYPLFYDIDGENVSDQINSINHKIIDNEMWGANRYGINIINVLECLLEFFIRNNVPAEVAENINVVILSQMELNQFTLSAGDSEETKFLFPMFDEFKKYKLPVPKIIFWNISGEMSSKSIYYGKIELINGFDPNIIDLFLESGVSINMEQIILKYKSFVSLL